MKTAIHIALWAFRLLVKLYPRPFRIQFGDEMEAVFVKRLDEARQDGPAALLAGCLHEASGLLAGLIREHGAAWSKGYSNTHSAMVNSLVLACCGVALLLRRGLASYFCNLADASGGGIVNRVACGLYVHDPGGRLWTIIGAIALVPLLWLIVRDTPRQEWNHRRMRCFALYCLIGVVCGVASQLSPIWMGQLPWAWGQWLFPVSIWLLPMSLAALYEVSRERRSMAAALASITVLLSATQAYSLGYAVLIAVGWAGPRLETLLIVGTGAANFGHFWAFLRWPVSDLMWRRGVIAIVGGAVLGIVIGRVYLWVIERRPSRPRPVERI